MSERGETRFWFGVSVFLIIAVFMILALDSDMLNRRIAALECRAGETEKCGPPWNSNR
jgi:hypothetical protein